VTTTVRITDQTHRRVIALAAATGQKMAQVLDDAVAEYERHIFWAEFADSYQRIADDPVAWEDVERERRGESAALQDGLD
jgi:predicted transcriptional regulator